MSSCIEKVSQEISKEPKDNRLLAKKSWQLNEEVHNLINEKTTLYKA